MKDTYICKNITQAQREIIAKEIVHISAIATRDEAYDPMDELMDIIQWPHFRIDQFNKLIGVSHACTFEPIFMITIDGDIELDFDSFLIKVKEL